MEKEGTKIGAEGTCQGIATALSRSLLSTGVEFALMGTLVMPGAIFGCHD